MSIPAKQRGAAFLAFAQKLVIAESQGDEFVEEMISEATKYSQQKQASGRLGGKQKASNAKATLKQRSSTTPSTALANNNSNIYIPVNITKEPAHKKQSQNRMTCLKSFGMLPRQGQDGVVNRQHWRRGISTLKATKWLR